MATCKELTNRGASPFEHDETLNTSLDLSHVNSKQTFRGNKDAIQSYLGNQLTESPIEEYRRKYKVLQAQLIQTKSEKQTLDEFNKRLITWNSQKDQQMNKLTKAVEDLQFKSNSQDRISRVVSDSDIVLSQDQYLKMCAEIKAINRDNNVIKQQLDIAKLEHKEEIELLKMQVRAHRDDWEAERHEKVEAENRALQVEEQMHLVEKKYKELQQQLIEKESCKCACHYNSSYGSQSEPIIRNFQSNISNESYHINSSRLIPRSSPSRHSSNDLEFDGRITPASPTATSNAPIKKTSNDIRCPECGKVFPQHVHFHFLDHFERCTRRSIL